MYWVENIYEPNICSDLQNREIAIYFLKSNFTEAQEKEILRKIINPFQPVILEDGYTYIPITGEWGHIDY